MATMLDGEEVKEYETWHHCQVQCPYCDTSWTAVFPFQATQLECPDCHQLITRHDPDFN